MIFHDNHLLADNSRELSYLFFSKIRKMSQNLSSAAVLIGALWVNNFSICSSGTQLFAEPKVVYQGKVRPVLNKHSREIPGITKNA